MALSASDGSLIPAAVMARPNGRLLLAVCTKRAELWSETVRGGRLLVGMSLTFPADPAAPALRFSGECDPRGGFSREGPGAVVKPIVETTPPLPEFSLVAPVLSLQGVCDVMVLSGGAAADHHFLGCMRPVAEAMCGLDQLLGLDIRAPGAARPASPDPRSSAARGAGQGPSRA